MLSADELLAGSELTFEVELPVEVLNPGGDAGTGGSDGLKAVRLRPLTVHDLQLISRAAKERDNLIATLMVQRALVEPEMSVPQVSTMHVGLVQFLLSEVNRISGISASKEQMEAAVGDPLTKAAFVLSSEFGWTPQEISELTLGQVLLHLQMLKERSQV